MTSHEDYAVLDGLTVLGMVGYTFRIVSSQTMRERLILEKTCKARKRPFPCIKLALGIKFNEQKERSTYVNQPTIDARVPRNRWLSELPVG